MNLKLLVTYMSSHFNSKSRLESINFYIYTQTTKIINKGSEVKFDAATTKRAPVVSWQD